MESIRFAVSTEGRVDYLDHGVLNLDGRTTKYRASHVEPWGWWRRLAFRIVRRCCGDSSAAAEWTRGWRTRWRVNLGPVFGPVLGPFDDRAEAIDVEELWLLSERLGRTWCRQCGLAMPAGDAPVCLDCRIEAIHAANNLHG